MPLLSRCICCGGRTSSGGGGYCCPMGPMGECRGPCMRENPPIWLEGCMGDTLQGPIPSGGPPPPPIIADMPMGLGEGSIGPEGSWDNC